MLPRINFKVYIHEASDIPGQWVAHCLDINVVSQGDSPGHAVEMLEEAILIVLEDDLMHGLDPLGRDRAPQDIWDAYAEIERIGRQVDLSKKDVADRERVTRFATYLSFVAAAEQQPPRPAERLPQQLGANGPLQVACA